MRDSRTYDTAVKHELSAVWLEDLFERGPTRALVPALAEKGARVDDRLLHVRVSGQDRICHETDIGGDSYLHQQHEQLAEPRQTRAGVTEQSPADLGRQVRQVGLAHQDEDAVARGAVELSDEGHGIVDAVQHVAADDQVGGRDFGIFPRARDDRYVVARTDVRPHALGWLDRGDPFEPRCERDCVTPGAGP